MAVQTVELKEFLSDLPAGIRFYDPGQKTISIAELTREEEEAIRKAFYDGLGLVEKISPKLADEYEKQFDLIMKFAQIAKADMDEKPITYPSTTGKLGVAWLIPQVVKYVATPSASDPAYTDYAANTWLITTTAGTAAYILGGSGATEFYKPKQTEGQRFEFLIFKNGLVQVGTSPVINQLKIESENRRDYGVWTVHPVADMSVEDEKPIYVYNTPFAIPAYKTPGIRLSGMPIASTTIDLRLFGMVVYEHDLLYNLLYIS